MAHPLQLLAVGVVLRQVDGRYHLRGVAEFGAPQVADDGSVVRGHVVEQKGRFVVQAAGVHYAPEGNRNGNDIHKDDEDGGGDGSDDKLLGEKLS